MVVTEERIDIGIFAKRTLLPTMGTPFAWREDTFGLVVQRGEKSGGCVILAFCACMTLGQEIEPFWTWNETIPLADEDAVRLINEHVCAA